MPRVPIDPKTLKPIKSKVKKRRTGWIVFGSLFLVGFTLAAISYITYATRMQTYDLFLENEALCQDIADAFAEKADAESEMIIKAYTNTAAIEYGTGNQVDVLDSSGTDDEDVISYNNYNDYFSSKVSSQIKKVFRTSIAQMILYERDTANNLYTVRFIEETNEIGYDMILVYVSEPLGDLEAARDYFGNNGEKVFTELSDNWYYIQDLGL